MNKKALAVVLAAVLVFGGAIGATVAYLTAKTETAVNTFTVGDIGDLDLDETDTDPEKEGDQHEYTVVPGNPITKDPTVTYKATAEDVAVYLFVKVDGDGWTPSSDGTTYAKKVGDVDNALTFTVADGWTKLESGVYYRAIEAGEQDLSYPVIKENTIAVSKDLKKTDLEGAAIADLSFTAYAIQQATFDTAADAWAEVSK